MCSYEEKKCPKCNIGFECKPGNIASCQCYEVKLTAEERDYIASRYTDCLCAVCILQLKNEYHQLQQQLQLKIFLRGR